MFVQNNVLRLLLGQDIPFVYPNLEWTKLGIQFWEYIYLKIQFYFCKSIQNLVND
jgi:hypothetical protein